MASGGKRVPSPVEEDQGKHWVEELFPPTFGFSLASLMNEEKTGDHDEKVHL